jgi:hypothetical protein
MGIFKKINDRQVHNGIFIALLLILTAGIAWWFNSNGSSKSSAPDEHPLSQAAAVSLCQLLPKFPGTNDCQDSEQKANVAGHSVWTNADSIPVLRMDLISTHNLSLPSPISSKAWLEGVLPEIKASGRQDWAEPKGLWSNAAITRSNNEQELLFEDNGIVVVMQSSTFDRDTLLKLAEQASQALRKAKPATSFEDDASPKGTPAAPEKP